MAPSSQVLKELSEVALGREKADLVIVNGSLVNVYSKEVLEGHSVAIKGGRIAFIGPDAAHAIGSQTDIVDAAGKFLLPGFIDGHMHLFWYYRVDQFLRHSMRGGTTAMVTESGEFFFTLGYPGAIEFYESVSCQPVKIYVTLPSMMTVSPVARPHSITSDMAETLYQRPEVVGIGESIDWAAILEGDERVLDLFALTISEGRAIEGHTAGARGNKLVALAAAGVSACHEPISVKEVVERLRLGMYVLIREGGVRRDLEAIAPVKDLGIDTRRLVLATDGLAPGELLKYGHMEYLVQKAIDLGFDPLTAIQMATINVAEHFGLAGDVGGIAPGRYADVVIVPDLHRIQAEYVFSNGLLVARDGVVVRPPRVPEFSEAVRHSLRLTANFRADDFDILVEDEGQVMVRVIDMHTGLVTRERQVGMVPVARQIKGDVGRGILKVAAIERAYRSGRRFVGLVSGFGLTSGAVASSDSWDSTDIVVVGADEADMAMAVNRLIELQGGVVVCAGGKVLSEWCCPIAGMLSDEPVEALAHRLHGVAKAAAGLGCILPDVHLSLTMLTSAAVPYLRICESGLVNVPRREIVDLVVR